MRSAMILSQTHYFEPLEPRRLMAAIPQFDHVVVVIEENHSYDAIIGDASVPYINDLANNGALFTNSFGITYPSQPNYLALFSGSTQGVTTNGVFNKFISPNLYTNLAAVGNTFAGYFESMPFDGYNGAASGAYVRKHNPVTQFTNVPESANLVFEQHFPTAPGSDYSFLPRVSFVVPNQLNDMHDGTRGQGDAWLQTNIGPYAQWAQSHNSLLIVTFDEDDESSGNHIPTIFYGANVIEGQYDQRIDHYDVLRTIEDMYGTPHANNTIDAIPITDVWDASVVTNPPAAPLTVGTAVASAFEVDVTWEDNSSDETEFAIQWATDPDFTQNVQIAGVGMNVEEYRAGGLTPLTTYYFRVLATNEVGDSPWSVTVADTPGNVVRLDNASTDGEITGTGTWYRSTAVAGFLNEDYFVDGSIGKGKKLRFTPRGVTTGTWDVFLRWSSDSNRPKKAPIDVTSVRGTDTVFVNQRLEGGHWVPLGRFNFDENVGPPMITIRTAGTGGYVVADAVKLVQTLDDPAFSTPLKTTKKAPAKIAGKFLIKDIVIVGRRIPIYSDIPKRNRNLVRQGVFSESRLIESLGLA